MARNSAEDVRAGAPNLQTCAHPECAAKFKKLGEGVLFAKTIDNPLAWGLPRGKKQKVVWLCAECAKTFEVAFDVSMRQVVLRPRRTRSKRAAA
jgi:hypothetical protein